MRIYFTSGTMVGPRNTEIKDIIFILRGFITYKRLKNKFALNGP